MEKMTKAMYFAQIREILVATEAAAELVEFVDAQMEQIANRSAKAKERAEAKKGEKDELYEAVAATLTADLQTADAIYEAVAMEGVSIAKVRARLTKMVNAGLAVKESVKGEGGRSHMEYRLA